MPARRSNTAHKRTGRKSRRALPPVYTNTIRARIEKTTTYTLQQLLANTLSGSQSQLDRNIQLISIGVQIIPTADPISRLAERRDAQLLLGGNWSGSGAVPIALRPPLMISAVNPTNMKYKPTLFQRQPCSAADTTNTFIVQLDTATTGEFLDLLITTRVHLLPQTVIVNVVGT